MDLLVRGFQADWARWAGGSLPFYLFHLEGVGQALQVPTER
ncbi:hypothetical protein SSCG_06046 [Streptomyces clavuligerus]|nr:hypothetical protein SSCG_06046 [Streptomyces clavuligerus]